MPNAQAGADDLTRRVIETIARTQGMKPDQISPESTFEKSEGWTNFKYFSKDIDLISSRVMPRILKKPGLQ